MKFFSEVGGNAAPNENLYDDQRGLIYLLLLEGLCMLIIASLPAT
jgi:hypothetical protein